MIVGVDASRLAPPRTGVGRVLEHLLRTWSTQEVPFELVRAFVPCPIGDVADGRVRFEVVPAASAGAWWQARRMRPLAAGVDVFFAPYTLPLGYRGPSVVWNLGVLERRFQARDLRSRARVWHFRDSARRADAVIANSQATKAAIVSEFGLDPTKVRVIWPGIGGPFRPTLPDEGPGLERALELLLGTRDPYLLFVGKVAPRRNLPALLEAFAHLSRDRPALQVVIVSPNTGPALLDPLVERLGLRGRVRHIQHLEQDELALLYRGALVFVLPTEQEGFSGTIPEALASGCPVLTVTHPALVEAQLDSAVLALPDADPRRLADSLTRLLDDDARRFELAAAGLRAAGRFSWESSAAETAAVLAEVAAASR